MREIKPRIRNPAVINKEVSVYWHPDRRCWTPNLGVEITFEVLGTYARRRGDRVWLTDAIYSSGIPQDMTARELKSLRESIKDILSLDEAVDIVRSIEPDVINLDRV